MKIDFQKTVKIEELAGLVSKRGGTTWASLWQVFYYTRLFKYVHRQHYPQIKIFYNKICTDKNLRKLCELEYFRSPREDVYCATNKVLPILKEAGFNTDLLPSESVGLGDINELNNTDVFVQAVKLPHFETLLYPQFKDRTSGKPYLKPDALLVQKYADKRRYKLTFLEIEAKKPGWQNYVENKRDNYLRLAQDINFYHYWTSVCPLLGLPKPDISSLYFSVCLIGNIAHKFGSGFRCIPPFTA